MRITESSLRQIVLEEIVDSHLEELDEGFMDSMQLAARRLGRNLTTRDSDTTRTPEERNALHNQIAGDLAITLRASLKELDLYDYSAADTIDTAPLRSMIEKYIGLIKIAQNRSVKTAVNAPTGLGKTVRGEMNKGNKTAAVSAKPETVRPSRRRNYASLEK